MSAGFTFHRMEDAALIDQVKRCQEAGHSSLTESRRLGCLLYPKERWTDVQTTIGTMIGTNFSIDT